MIEMSHASALDASASPGACPLPIPSGAAHTWLWRAGYGGRQAVSPTDMTDCPPASLVPLALVPWSPFGVPLGPTDDRVWWVGNILILMLI